MSMRIDYAAKRANWVKRLKEKTKSIKPCCVCAAKGSALRRQGPSVRWISKRRPAVGCCFMHTCALAPNQTRPLAAPLPVQSPPKSLGFHAIRSFFPRVFGVTKPLLFLLFIDPTPTIIQCSCLAHTGLQLFQPPHTLRTHIQRLFPRKPTPQNPRQSRESWRGGSGSSVRSTRAGRRRRQR